MAVVEKSYGYLELNLSSGVIPIKFGHWTLENFCIQYGIGDDELNTLFHLKKIKNKDGEDIDIMLPVNMIKFTATAMWLGASYFRFLEGKPLYNVAEAYQWLDELGLGHPDIIKVSSVFYTSIRNGGTVPDIKIEEDSDPDVAKQKKSDLDSVTTEV